MENVDLMTKILKNSEICKSRSFKAIFIPPLKGGSRILSMEEKLEIVKDYKNVLLKYEKCNKQWS